MRLRWSELLRNRWWLGLAGFGLVERVGLALFTQPASFGDTPTYFRLGRTLMSGGLAGYDGTRVPVYPLLAGLLGGDGDSIRLVQLLIGWVTSLMLFYLMFALTENVALGFATGMLYNLTAGLVLFENNLLSETLTMALVIACLAGFARVRTQPAGTSRLVAVVGLGLLASLAGLTRTLFFLLPPLMLPFIAAMEHDWQGRLRLAVAFSAAPILLLGGWIAFIYSHYDMLSPTTMGGYHLVQHTGVFFEHLPDEEAVIRDTYLAVRDARLAERGSQTNAIWDAIPLLTERTGLSFFALSAKLQSLSWWLIRHYPGLYLGSVVDGWIDFWKAPVYWQRDLFSVGWQRFITLWAWAGRGLSLLANAAFLMLSSAYVVVGGVRRQLRPPAEVGLAAILVLLASVVQTLVDHGDNPRFLVPLQMVVIIVVIWAAWALRRPAAIPEAGA
jgi:hypothetical protein